jgi:hypothetical protein
MSIVRWLGAALVTSGATLALSIIVGLAVAVLFPDVVRHYHLLYRDDPVAGAAVGSAIEWGVLAAMFMGPLLAFTLVRDFNAAIQKPGPMRGWWRFVLGDSLRSFLIIGLAGFGLCGLIAASISLQGGTMDEVRTRAFFALVLGHGAAGLVVALGHFVRNPPDLSLGSSHDRRLSEGKTPDRL